MATESGDDIASVYDGSSREKTTGRISGKYFTSDPDSARIG
jgi:hypothetical protein